jgi:hypothetical protein
MIFSYSSITKKLESSLEKTSSHRLGFSEHSLGITALNAVGKTSPGIKGNNKIEKFMTIVINTMINSSISRDRD